MGSSRKFSAGLLLLCVFFFTKAVFAESTQLNGTHTFRVKRQGCQDGTYEHEGINCCKCAAGQRVAEHCTKTVSDGRCVFCENGSTYNSEPNSKVSCEICTSCDQENANLEEEEPCTPLKDRKCRCKEGHYCNSAEGSCKICHPCNRCSSTGVKEPCTLTSDAICKEESTGLSGGAVAGIVITVLVFVTVALGVVFRKKILGFWKRDASNPPGPVNDPLLPVDMEPHIVEVAEIIGWKVMSQIGLSCKMANAIDSVRHNHPGDSDMWTQELLRRWMELQGRAASVELIKTLRKMRHNNKADQIKEKLYPIDSPTV
ncbi:tumor necrosis factor receptor superfamily member 26 [Poeciliopsis prolifica]|uniref:tumor necrosis factor receptor superfamily member 26 n=1 Tax=Poeciliopsis prolifica TaxID=188132 RepID=UPI0024137ACE|nr:tumor necrosis factor receptor superfamily member 26 [Poeciliopsis prolifica]